MRSAEFAAWIFATTHYLTIPREKYVILDEVNQISKAKAFEDGWWSNFDRCIEVVHIAFDEWDFLVELFMYNERCIYFRVNNE